MKKTNDETIKVEAKEQKDTCCVICKSNHDTIEFKGKKICRPCVAEALAM